MNSSQEQKKSLEKIDITNISLEKCKDPSFIKTWLFNFEKNNQPISWEVIEPREYVSTLLFDKDKNSLVLVKQFRPAVFLSKNRSVINYKNSSKNKCIDGSCGVTFELCSGFKEEEENIISTAIREVYEETGYDISKKSDIQHVFSFHSATDCEGKIGHIYFAEVDSTDLIGTGGGLKEEKEETENFYLPITEISSFITDFSINKDCDCIAALLWYSKRNNN